MSRTNKSTKGPGFEYWSKRPGKTNFGGAKPGRFSKRTTHRAERRQAAHELRGEVDGG